MPDKHGKPYTGETLSEAFEDLRDRYNNAKSVEEYENLEKEEDVLNTAFNTLPYDEQKIALLASMEVLDARVSSQFNVFNRHAPQAGQAAAQDQKQAPTGTAQVQKQAPTGTRKRTAPQPDAEAPRGVIKRSAAQTNEPASQTASESTQAAPTATKRVLGRLFDALRSRENLDEEKTSDQSRSSRPSPRKGSDSDSDV